MNDFARWSMNSQSVALVLGFIVLGLSLRPTAGRLLFMALAYGVISIAFGWAGLFRQLFEIRMVTAFGGTPVPVLAYLSPLLEAAFFLTPIYGLFVPVPLSRRIGIISFGVILPLMLLVEIIGLYVGPQPGGRLSQLSYRQGEFSIPHGLTALVLAALWLRIHSCRLGLSKV